MVPLQRTLKEPGGEEDERRLFYVAVTRAKDQCYLSSPVLDYKIIWYADVQPVAFYQRNSAAGRTKTNSARLSNGHGSMIISFILLAGFLLHQLKVFLFLGLLGLLCIKVNINPVL